MRNLQEQVKKTFCCQKLFCPFTIRTNCDLKVFLATAKLSPNAPQCAPMRPNAPRDEKNKEKLLCDI